MNIRIAAAIPPSQNPSPGICDECGKSMAGNLLVVISFPDRGQEKCEACAHCYQTKLKTGDWVNEGTSLEDFIARI